MDEKLPEQAKVKLLPGRSWTPVWTPKSYLGLAIENPGESAAWVDHGGPKSFRVAMEKPQWNFRSMRYRMLTG
jgi:hypothetical protein